MTVNVHDHNVQENGIKHYVPKLYFLCVIYEQISNDEHIKLRIQICDTYEGRTESHEQLFFVCELGTADEGECGGRWNQLLCYA